DYTYPRAASEEELKNIENIINAEVQKSENVSVKEMGYEEAIKSGALAFFDEKYGDKVRVVRVGGDKAFSVELCGGTHLSNTSDIGLFKILSESSVASGVRRIEAITSTKALSFLDNRSEKLYQIERAVGVNSEALLEKVNQLLQAQKTLQKENETLK